MQVLLNDFNAQTFKRHLYSTNCKRNSYALMRLSATPARTLFKHL